MQDVIELIKLIFTVILIGHLFCCLWHGVAFYQIDYTDTWLHYLGIEKASNVVKYNNAFYWALMTMTTVGYGDIVPKNDLERLCANLTMLIACGVFAFSINSIGIMLQNLNSRTTEYR